MGLLFYWHFKLSFPAPDSPPLTDIGMLYGPVLGPRPADAKWQCV